MSYVPFIRVLQFHFCFITGIHVSNNSKNHVCAELVQLSWHKFHRCICPAGVKLAQVSHDIKSDNVCCFITFSDPSCCKQLLDFVAKNVSYASDVTPISKNLVVVLIKPRIF